MAVENKDKSLAVALHGTLQESVVADLQLLGEFIAVRQEVMSGLYSRRLPRNTLRDELVRLVITEFGHRQERRIAFYVLRCAELGSATAVREEIARLVIYGVVSLVPNASDRRAMTVMPTQRAIDFYNLQMPTLSQEAARIFKR